MLVFVFRKFSPGTKAAKGLLKGNYSIGLFLFWRKCIKEIDFTVGLSFQRRFEGRGFPDFFADVMVQHFISFWLFSPCWV